MKIGNLELNSQPLNSAGSVVEIEGENYYKISNVDSMKPFFMSVVSDSNHWMFIGSNGGLTAGRKDSDRAIFPYYTDDKIMESVEVSGPKTLMQIKEGGDLLLWEPFSDRYQGVYKIQRNLYKNQFGNQIIFEEINESLGLKFSYQWKNSKKYGFGRFARLENLRSDTREIKVLDGLQNILATNIKAEVQNSKSNLVDAYKRQELDANGNTAIYTLNAVIVDRAEPAESLRATMVYHLGADGAQVHISSEVVSQFRKGLQSPVQREVRGQKAAYLMEFDLSLEGNSTNQWIQIIDESLSSSDLLLINESLKDSVKLEEDLNADIVLGTERLKELSGNADGLQCSEDHLENTRHFANVMFNIMRGGIFDHNYDLERSDLIKYYKKSNKDLFAAISSELEAFDELINLEDLKKWAMAHENLDVLRLATEYLPLKFSRRHGDPSRPWNKFSINTVDEVTGEKILDYQGNWRDIYQNWEALAVSYPNFVQSMIFKFLNTSTFDGYNPYRVTKDGFDWEIVEPDDPWAFIGYWGDHQIIYLLKFLELSEHYFPGQLVEVFNQKSFVYANVPYKIKSYEDILKNPKDTIVFDNESDKSIREMRKSQGADGALLKTSSGAIQKANFIEKILATLLAKASNYIPEGGIWLNTQRPEWNDANNALVGNGVSMVTLYYLRRFVVFFENLLENSSGQVEVSEEIFEFFQSIKESFASFEENIEARFTDMSRKDMMNALGQAGSAYRNSIYSKGFSGRVKSISLSDFKDFCSSFKKHIEYSIDSNKRVDGLYHSYNLVSYTDKEAKIDYLTSMLEGQVAVLTSQYLKSRETVSLLDSLRMSDLYREDQSSYMLYPDREIMSFGAKNFISKDLVESSVALSKLVEHNETSVIELDCNGGVHFKSTFQNANQLKDALDLLGSDYQETLEEDQGAIFTVFEKLFNHKAFTGRSGTFFGYEGLGSIYWHMVSKLVLAVEEAALLAHDSQVDIELQEKLKQHYYEAKFGIGLKKTPEVYGAIPTDPYSHTPAHKGAQQPGMTGQVKEDVISRFLELGVQVKQGKICFDSFLLNRDEFLKSSQEFYVNSVSGLSMKLILKEGELGFTYCQVPVIFTLSEEKTIEVEFEDVSRDTLHFDGLELSSKLSKSIFDRSGEVKVLRIGL
ncbi:MAG: hypothetical protein ACPGRE_07355 [Flavobacteriaceae bacterium]